MIPDVSYYQIPGEDGNPLYQIEGQGNLLNQDEFNSYKRELGTFGRLKSSEPTAEQRGEALKSLQTMIEDRFLNQYPDDMDRAVQEADDAFNEYKEPGYKKRMAGDQAFEELLAKAQTEVDPMLWTEADELAQQKENVMIADQTRYRGMERIPYNPDKYFRTNSQSKTAEAKRNAEILATGRAPKGVPYDSFMAEDMNYRPDRPGIDGEYLPGSEIRVHTQLGDYGKEPILDGTIPIIVRKNVWTENPNAEVLKQLYKEFQGAAKEHNSRDSRFKQSDSIEAFNRTLAEYYGQQGLLLSDRFPVSDAERSDGVKTRAARGENTAMGTNRLIEQTLGMNDDEGFYQKDYRYKDANGRIIVGDSQTLPSADGRGSLIYGDIFNASRLDPYLSAGEPAGRELKNVLMDKAAEVRSRGENLGMDTVIKELMDEGVLPPINSVGNIKQRGEQGIDLGKSTGKSPLFKNINDVNPSQGDLDEIVFSELPSNFDTKLGAKPINMTIVDTEGMNRAMIDPTMLSSRNVEHFPVNNVDDPNVRGPVSKRDQKGKTRLKMNTKRLAAQGIARQLLPKELMDQLK